MKEKEVITDMKKRISDILMSVSWREFSRQYFEKSSSWLYHKLDGIDGHGGTDGFTPEQTRQFKNALLDLSERIRKAAETL